MTTTIFVYFVLLANVCMMHASDPQHLSKIYASTFLLEKKSFKLPP